MHPSAPKTWLMGAEAFERRMPHHDGIEALWETKWKFPCTKGVYPFHDGVYEDFAPIFESMIKNGVQDGTSASYTHAFFPAAKALEAAGNAALREGKSFSEASSLYLRAACLLRIARFPYITAYPKVNDAAKWEAWTWQKAVYMKAGKLWNEPVTEVEIPFAFADEESGDWADKPIPVYLRVPQEEEAGTSSNNNNAKSNSETAERRTKKWPAVVLMTGLDGYRPDNTVRCNEFLARGWAAVVVEIPGTADCPASSSDPDAAERLWDSVLAWMQRDGRFDMCRILAWGLSSGGYYAVRLAHTHAGRIRGCVAQGAGTHWFFNAKWLERIDGHEYPFHASPPLAMKHGFDTVDEYRENAQTKFSLLENGILQKPCTRLLLINGTMDGLMPIEDSMLLFEHGSPKEARFFPGALHMGYPMANASVYPWMESVMNGE